MNKLKVQDFHGKQVIDSRDVARMVERNHYELLKSIRQYAQYLNEGEIPAVDFFIESSYVDGKGEPRPNYLITKKGCDMIANKTTGKKGVLFTAAYVTAFDEMKKALSGDHFCRIPQVSPGGLAKLMAIHKQAIVDLGGTPADVAVMIAELDQTWGVPVPSPLAAQLPGQTSLFDRPVLEG